ncbi:prolipoprotein diacylglyceryl transferase [Saccharibacillus alkalitolerans]|uniref:Prolipoprotein diacylglyceryl transferase n=1 Tax=Saccharibacillus alkalitolerans TaxID=2705290 RepID=A0ABX0F3W5_9BACL|nr:prolipoprotein diacylglyceryl transferase family protein [Saccharibacillus alkalitolerans]NGZ74550.1 prolipoprotein diacylglyceryl transferase [Saccharibacillus alkalitolerans]
MEFPVYIPLGPWRIHPHVLFETLSYFIGFRVYLWTRRSSGMPKLTSLQILAGTILGAALGAKLLYWLEDPAATWEQLSRGHFLWGGKTIVGGLLGGLIGVELSKKLAGWKPSTGDDFVYPLIVGMVLGRIGCFLTGLEDHTYGVATNWITGVDFGDGVSRHPAQLYEIAFLLGLGLLLFPLYRKSRDPASAETGYVQGRMFQWFMAGYLAFRFVIEFIKPTPHPYLGLNNIQLACIAGLIYYAWLMTRRGKREAEPAAEAAHAG